LSSGACWGMKHDWKASSQALFPGLPDEAHPHPRGLAWRLTGEPFGAGPRDEAFVVAGGVGTRGITMRAPAVFIFGSGQLSAAAGLRSAGETAGIVRAPAVAHGREDVAAPDLVAKEMRRCRHHDRIGRFRRHPIHTREME